MSTVEKESSDKGTKKTSNKRTQKKVKGAREDKSTKAPEVAAPFLSTSETYGKRIQALVSEIDKRLVALSKSVDNDLKKINLSDDLEKINKSLDDSLNKLNKGTDSIFRELNVAKKFDEFYTQYYRELGLAFGNSASSVLPPEILGRVLEDIASVQQVSLYLSIIFNSAEAKTT